MLAEIELQDIVTLVALVAAALFVFYIVHKIVRLMISLLIVAVLIVGAIVYGVHAGYISEKSVERLNPLRNERFAQSIKEIGSFVGEKATDAAEKAISKTMSKKQKSDDEVD